MTALAKGALAAALPDLPERSFATLTPAESAALATTLRPLPWIDGLLTAMLISPADPDPEDWLEYVFAEGEFDKSTVSWVKDVASLVIGQLVHIADALFEGPESYRPFWPGEDQLAAAAEWAAGFRSGIRLEPEPWAPLIDDDDARQCLALIFALEREESLPEAERANSPFADVSSEARERIRAAALRLLPAAIPALHLFSAELAELEDDDLDDDFAEDFTPAEPYQRAAPKIGRNESCPCGSGKKYKKCCLG